ncbi:hypothetical protein [Fibrella aquatilis]|uniref:Uncharacterized protein n=1 Tax=Fibrella aquatilis TaxID=2817059 RepID=A0A939GAW1_9BACT|nr:hypothetical protein [Fibrella aquatilis]MBO0933272.1 hypothetical protein [Fibrella aquatilis]
MKQLYSLLLVMLGGAAQAQDVVYLTNQARLEGTLTELSAEKVSVRVAKGESSVKFTYGADKVVVVVNARGKFVCMDQLAALPADRRNRFLAGFMDPRDLPTYDMVIRNNPVTVSYGKVSAATGDVITFTPHNGTTIRVPKADLIGIFYQNGTHLLVAPPTVLCDKIDLLGGPPPAVAATPTPPVPVQKPAPKPAPAPDESRSTSRNILKMSDEEYSDYQTQALERVQEFGVMLGIVADKTVESGQKDKAIAAIMKLFKPDAVIQVSSVVRGGQPSAYRLKDYLIRLKLLPYKSVTLEWTDVQYVQDLTQKADGNYYGKIRGEQRFTGLSQTDETQYSDVTQKDVDVMLTPYRKQKEGEALPKWAILLGNVGIVATR